MSDIIDFTAYKEGILDQERTSQNNAARERFGSWNTWSKAEIMYLLQELCDGHWEDNKEGFDFMRGAVTAYGGLVIALAANDETKDKAEIHRTILNGIWIACDWLASIESPIDPKLKKSIDAILDATKWSAIAKDENLGSPDSPASVPKVKCEGAKENVLRVFQVNRSKPYTAEQLAMLLGVEGAAIRSAIDSLRKKGYNIRNKRRTGFWLEDSSAPELGPVGGDDRWQSEVPVRSTGS